VNRRWVVTVAVLAAALALVAVAVVRMTSGPSDEAAVGPEAAAGPAGETGAGYLADADSDPDDEAMRHLKVRIFYPSATRPGLVGEEHEIFMTTAPGDRAKQILADLISGPEGKGALRALPPGTRLRQVYVLEHGTAYLDFSADLARGMNGGSTEEICTVYAIVNSVALNVPEIRRVGILIEGQPIETLNGHLDLRRPLPPDRAIAARSAG